MRGITKRVMAASAVAVLTTAGPLLSTGSMSAAFGSDYNRVGGTGGNDHLAGTGHADLLAGRAGHDTIRPNRGADIVRAAAGDDRIFLFNDGVVDRIHCGDGFDVVSYHFSVDQHDVLDPNCEGVIA